MVRMDDATGTWITCNGALPGAVDNRGLTSLQPLLKQALRKNQY